MNVKISPTPMLVVAGALMDDHGQILMHRRRLSTMHGGLWEFPGGKVEGGESPESALVRELKEELGIEIAIESLMPVGFAADSLMPDSPRPPVVILLYSCKCWDGLPVCLDGEEIGWFASGELAMLAMPPLDVPLSRRLVELMQKGLI